MPRRGIWLRGLAAASSEWSMAMTRIPSTGANLQHGYLGNCAWTVTKRGRTHARAPAPSLLMAAAFVLGAVFPRAALACATCGCSLSTDAAMGYSDIAGWRATFEFDFINQDQLRSGTSSISNSQVAAINDAGGNQEVEKQTINRYFTAGISYQAQRRVEFQPAGSLHRPQPLHLWRRDEPSHSRQGKRRER